MDNRNRSSVLDYERVLDMLERGRNHYSRGLCFI